MFNIAASQLVCVHVNARIHVRKQTLCKIRRVTPLSSLRLHSLLTSRPSAFFLHSCPSALLLYSCRPFALLFKLLVWTSHSYHSRQNLKSEQIAFFFDHSSTPVFMKRMRKHALQVGWHLQLEGANQLEVRV